jgi:hypothetical protein
MPHTIETTVYNFEELSPKGKECARNWWRECEQQEYSAMLEYDDFVTVGALLGICFKTGDHSKPKIYWSGFSSQGDGASFVGSYTYAKGALAAIKSYAPKDAELARIASELQALQAHNFYRLAAYMTQGMGSNFYSHSGTMAVHVEDSANTRPIKRGTDDAMRRLMRDFADWIYNQLEADYEWRMADEQVDETILANEYTFSETGKREG